MDEQEIAKRKTSINKRLGHLKGRLTNIENFLETNEIISSSEFRTRLESVEKIYANFELITNELLDILSDDDFNENYQNHVQDFEDRYLNLKATMLDRHESTSKQNKKSMSAKTETSETIKPLIKLPELNIPHFDGDPLKWITFKDIFDAVINKNTALTDIVKFTYLQNSLKGEAKQSLGHIELSEAGYQRAWSELVQRFDNPRLIVERHIDALIELQPIHNSNANEMRQFTNVVLSHVTSLEACDLNFDECSEIIVMRLVIRKLDRESIRDWEKQNSSKELPTWKIFREFLEKKCRVLDSISNVGQCFNKSTSNNTHRQNKPINKSKSQSFAIPNSNTNSHKPNCRLCNGIRHPFFNCPSFLNLNVTERFNKIKDMKACINCLNPYHTVSDCQSSGCKLCTKRHHTLLHMDQKYSNKEKTNQGDDTQIKSTDHSQTNTLPVVNNTNESQNFSMQKSLIGGNVILPTAIVLLKRLNGGYVECRALLDSGSQSNFITSSMAQKLHSKINNINSIDVTGISTSSTKVNEMISTQVKSRYNNSLFSIDFFVINKISNSLPQHNINISRWSIPSHIQLADPNFNESRPIDMLIGAELFPNILTSNKICLKQDLPVLQESLFGWVIFGKEEIHLKRNFTFHTSFIQQEEDAISLMLTKFWETENLPPKKFLSADEDECERLFQSSHYRDSNGRYSVYLPLHKNLTLGDSKQMASRRFSYLEKKLNANPELKHQYVSFMREYLSLGHMKEIDESEQTDSLTYYIPHHAILRPNSSSSKLRVVFDASAKSANGVSLNDRMMVGPTVQSELFNIILRFRKYRYAMSSDITKMYRQVQVDPSQTGLQRILWRENSDDPLKSFELTTVTYGTAAAPFLATRCIKQLAIDENMRYPLASKVLLNDTYVDDIVTGTDTLSQALQLQTELRKLTRSGCFHLHKWCANDEILLKEIPVEDREVMMINEFNNGECIKALGLLWQPREDVFTFRMPEYSSELRMTKRKILSEIAKLFDPLGLLAPIIITAKIFLQDLWKTKLDWDDFVPTDMEAKWIAYRNNLTNVAKVQLPRCLFNKGSSSERIELHGFADASEKAYGACIYIRTINNDDKIRVNLVCSKSRVAPLKTTTLPHLELCAAHLLSRVVSATIEALQLKLHDVVLWTDSTITLYWIATPPYKLKTFVANRVNEIQERSINFTWRHIASQHNPADIISRGIMPQQLNNIEIWWKGPHILHSREIIEDIQKFNIKNYNIDLELKPNVTAVVTQTNHNKDELDELRIFNRFSSYQKLIRVIAYSLRFISKCKKLASNNTQPTVQERENALTSLVKVVQLNAFKTEIRLLSSNKSIPNNSNLKTLTPFLDKDHVLRVGGRLKYANIEYDAKHQMLLPSNHTFVMLIFKYEHENQGHAGPQLLLAIVRKKFWPINGKNTAKKVVRNCIICSRTKPTIVKQIMGNLPIERISQSKPFYNTGVDYCGPFFIKNKFQRKSAPYKVYVASFVCFATKSVHLEVVSDLTSQSFIACLKRFTSRRGRVSNIWSDNASTFVGASREIKELFQKFISGIEQIKIASFCAEKQITWHFIPPRAPNFGGLWEASIKSFKFHLKRITKGVIMTLEEFETLTIQIEGILNSRPLTPLSDDPNDPEPLTPNHFLTGGINTGINEPLLSNIPDNYLTKWQKLNKMIESFWKRYSIEYLQTLQNRVKWKQESPNVKVNDIVMLVEENIPSIRWLLGRIVSVILGSDNKVRVVEVQTKNGIFKRAISKLVKLPVDNE